MSLPRRSLFAPSGPLRLSSHLDHFSGGRSLVNADQIEAEAVRIGSATINSCLTDDNTAYDQLSEEYDTAANPSGLPPVFWSTSDERSINEYQYQHI
jgi:hypothetical protein